MPFVRARRLVAFPSIIALDLITVLTVSAFWGIVGVGDAKTLVNEGCDVEAIVVALYGRDFITADKRARSFYEDVGYLAATLWGPT